MINGPADRWTNPLIVMRGFSLTLFMAFPGFHLFNKTSLSPVFSESVSHSPADGEMNGLADGRTDPVIEMSGRI